tara:strand:+ start:222 stop:530 length:309 start_codon:yes stop_codon:yes gene_type:complete
MSKVGIQLKIDVTKIDKALLFKGTKGSYLDATIFVELDTPDQYGNHGMVTQDVSKESRDAGEKGPILGNVKVFWKDGGNSAPVQKTAPKAAAGDNFDDDIPF